MDITDPFAPHRISESIRKDLEATIKHPTMKAFRDRLAYKSPKTAQQDEDAMIFLIQKLELYAKGWNSANMKSVGELLTALEYIEQEKKTLNEICDMQNDLINRMIKLFAPQMDADTLNELRDLEKTYRSIR